MSTTADIKARFVDGRRVLVTNHYIDRPDHPCYGTRETTIVAPNSSSIGLPAADPDAHRSVERLAWPKAVQLVEQADGRVEFYGHPMAGDLFLTFQFVD